MIHKIALVAAIILPLWNIPLILRIVRRRSSKDISLFWAVGVWVCLLAMFPSAVQSPDIVWKVFTLVNFFFFSAVTFCTILFHKGRDD